MKNYKYSMIFTGVLFLLVSSPEVRAFNCVQSPDCASLGYTKNATDCKDKVAVKCPTDNTKVFCKDEVAAQAPLPILYGDGTVSKELVAGKTPIGVVISESAKLALALTDVKKDGTPGSEGIHWSLITSYDNPYLTNCSTESGVMTCATDGRSNTDKILTCGNTCSAVPAALAVRAYQPAGCTADFCKRGQWHLPSIKELIPIHFKRPSFEATLSLLEKYGAVNLPSLVCYWSSNEASAGGAWALCENSNSTIYQTVKTTTYNVRPVINYGVQKPAQNIKFVINISNSCPRGLSFSGSYQGPGSGPIPATGTFSCTSELCYDQGRYDGNGSNETETVVKEGTSITLSNLNSNFTSIKSMATGKVVPVSGGMAYFALNNYDEVVAALGAGAYDFWMLQCSPVASAKASVTAEVIVTGSSSNMFVDLNGTSVTCTVTATEDGRSAPVTINGGKTANSFAAGQVTLACPRTIKPITGSYTQYRISESEVDNGGRQTLNGLSVRVNATPNGSHTLKIYYQAI